MHGLSDNSVTSVTWYPMYYMASLLHAFNLYYPLVLNGGSLGTSVIFTIADSKKKPVMIVQVVVNAT